MTKITTHRFRPRAGDLFCGREMEPFTGTPTVGRPCGFPVEDHARGPKPALHVDDVANEFLVGSQGGQTVIVNLQALMLPLDSARAFRLAAWLVSVAEVNREIRGETGPTFKQVLKAVRNT